MNSGRPKVLTAPVTFTMRIEREVMTRLEVIAKKQDVTVSEVIRRALSRLAGFRRTRPRPKTSRSE